MLLNRSKCEAFSTENAVLLSQESPYKHFVNKDSHNQLKYSEHNLRYLHAETLVSIVRSLIIMVGVSHAKLVFYKKCAQIAFLSFLDPYRDSKQ